MTPGSISGAVAGYWIFHDKPLFPNMADHHHKKHFLNLPKYIGGSEAFRKFIAENLRYPEAALEAKTEGSVIVEYDISDDGLVHSERPGLWLR
jgi:hypothetical protein